MTNTHSALSLGTAQWGSPYGLTNERGRLSDADISEIVETALAAGITAADTHRTTDPKQGYGRAQARLRPWVRGFRVTSKIYGRSEVPILDQLQQTLSELDSPSLHGCLVHDWAELSEPERRTAAMGLEAVRQGGYVSRVGISAYEESEVASAVACFERLDVVQVPASVVDQRLVNSSVLERLGGSGVEIQVRSIFLQGLLLEPHATSPLAQHPDIRRFHLSCREQAIAPIAACLAFVKSLVWATQVVVGVTSADELRQITDAWGQESTAVDWAHLASSDAALLDPRLWARS